MLGDVQLHFSPSEIKRKQSLISNHTKGKEQEQPREKGTIVSVAGGFSAPRTAPVYNPVLQSPDPKDRLLWTRNRMSACKRRGGGRLQTVD